MTTADKESHGAAFAIRVGRAFLQYILGVALALVFIEAILQLNPKLLWAGMGLPAPSAESLQAEIYDVHYSDADIFYWHADIIRPIPPELDRIESNVHYATDELGFPNPAPLPESVDVAILGRSYSMGAQAATPWPQIMAEQNGLSVINLSQGGSGIDIKRQYYQRYGLLHHPRWVVVEILPSMDIIGYRPNSSFLVPDLPFSLIQHIGNQLKKSNNINPTQNNHQIYPYTLDIEGQSVDLVFYSYYLSSLTVDGQMLSQSRDWQGFQQQLNMLNKSINQNSACMLLLFVPTKENIYFSLASQPEQLEPVVKELKSWQFDSNSFLVQTGTNPSAALMQKNAFSIRDFLKDYASANHIAWADPTSAMLDLVKAGQDPFMVYDSHWSADGHKAVAQIVSSVIQNSTCP